MAIIGSKTVLYVGLSFTDDLYCSDDETYKIAPLFTHDLMIVRQDGLNLHFVHEKDFALHVNFNQRGRAALTYNPDTSNPFILQSGNLNTATFDVTLYDDEYTWGPYIGQSGYPSFPNFTPNGGTGMASTNIPVFATEGEANLYLNAESEDQAHIYLSAALNYKKSEYNPETTKVWTYSSRHANVTLTRGNIQEISNIGYRTLKFQSNTEPAFYIDSNTFQVVLIAPNVVASVYAAGPEQVADNIPQSQWTQEALAYNGPFYTSVSKWIYLKDETPSDGNYVYPVEYQTNIPVFANREDAEEAIRTGDYSKAGPAGVKEYDVKIGDEEETTVFGGGGFLSPFMTILSGSKSDLHRLADFLFNSDEGIWENIKKGLEAYGSNPIDFIISCRAFGFNVSQVVNESTRNDIYFGSYLKHFDTPFNEVINMAHKYIDAGSFFMYPIQYCYLDFEPYTTLSAWFPYHGWEQLDIKKYYQKTVNVRYYVDILSGQAIIVTICDGVVCDQFGPCEMGTELPLTGANYAQWAQGQVRLLAQAGQNILAGGINGAAGGPVAAAGGMLASAPAASMNIFEAKQQGGPKNTMITKGNFGSNLMNYLPGYVIFRFDIHEMLEPDLLQPLAGRPSYSSGTLRNFSGFVAGKVVKLDTSGMTDAEAERIKSLILSGIYI